MYCTKTNRLLLFSDCKIYITSVLSFAGLDEETPGDKYNHSYFNYDCKFLVSVSLHGLSSLLYCSVYVFVSHIISGWLHLTISRDQMAKELE